MLMMPSMPLVLPAVFMLMFGVAVMIAIPAMFMFMLMMMVMMLAIPITSFPNRARRAETARRSTRTSLVVRGGRIMSAVCSRLRLVDVVYYVALLQGVAWQRVWWEVQWALYWVVVLWSRGLVAEGLWFELGALMDSRGEIVVALAGWVWDGVAIGDVTWMRIHPRAIRHRGGLEIRWPVVVVC